MGSREVNVNKEIANLIRKLELEKRKYTQIQEDYEVLRKTSGMSTTRSSSLPLGSKTREKYKRPDRHTQQTKLNLKAHNNRRIREEIDGVRRQRTRMKKLVAQLRDDIKRSTINIGRLKGKGDSIQAQTQIVTDELSKLKSKLAKERQLFGKDIVTHISGMEQIASDKRQLLKTMVSARKSTKSVAPHFGDEILEGKELTKRILKEALLSHVKRRKIAENNETMKVYQNVFEQIEQTTQITEVDDLVQVFQEWESRNFKLMDFSNSLRVETTKREEEIQQMRQQIQELKDKKRDTPPTPAHPQPSLVSSDAEICRGYLQKINDTLCKFLKIETDDTDIQLEAVEKLFAKSFICSGVPKDLMGPQVRQPQLPGTMHSKQACEDKSDDEGDRFMSREDLVRAAALSIEKKRKIRMAQRKLKGKRRGEEGNQVSRLRIEVDDVSKASFD